MENLPTKSKEQIVNQNIELTVANSQKSLSEFKELLNTLKGTDKEILIESISKHVSGLQSYFEKSLDLIKTELAGEVELQEKELLKIQESFNEKMKEYKQILIDNSQEEPKKIN